jgi:hypothetical protein
MNMGKKVLFIVGSILVGAVLALISWYGGLYSTYQKHIDGYIDAKDYTSAERYYAVMIDSNKVYSKEENGTCIEVLYAVNTSKEDVYSGETYVGSFDAYNKTIQISIFNLGVDFDLMSDNPNLKNGKVIATINKTNIEFPFYGEKVDCYDDYLTYGFFNLSISYDEYIKKLVEANLPTSSKIDSFQIVDGANKVQFVLELENSVGFTSKFHNDVNPIINAYNEAKKAEIIKVSENPLPSTEEVKKPDFKELTDSNGSYKLQHTLETVQSSKEFATTFAISIVIIVIIDLGLGIFLFKKSKSQDAVKEEIETAVIIDGQFEE